MQSLGFKGKRVGKPQEPQSILLLRPDRLGDVLVSTPVHHVLKQQFPDAQIHWLVQDWVAPLLEGLDGVASVIRYQPKGPHLGFRGVLALASQIRAVQADWVIALQSTPRVSLAALLAQVPHRVGPYSKLHSFILYNHGVRQNRSDCRLHEAEYGVELLQALGVSSPSPEALRRQGPQVAIHPDALAWASGYFHKREIGEKAAVCVHPGMGGSALNWPFERYTELVKLLARDGVPVLLTAGAGEGALQEKLLNSLRDLNLHERAQVHAVSAEQDSMDLQRLAALQSLCQVVVAPSTGPLHLAAAVGANVVSVYPPIQVQHPRRWGPYISPEKSKVFLSVDEHQCGQRFKCRGQACPVYPCMARVPAQDVKNEVTQFLVNAKEIGHGSIEE